MLSVPSARLFQYSARSTIIGLTGVLDLTATEALASASLVPMPYDLRERLREPVGVSLLKSC